MQHKFRRVRVIKILDNYLLKHSLTAIKKQSSSENHVCKLDYFISAIQLKYIYFKRFRLETLKVIKKNLSLHYLTSNYAIK